MWAPYVNEYRKAEKPVREGSHVRKDSAMDAHFAAVALSGMSIKGEKQIGCNEDESFPPRRRNQNWIKEPLQKEEAMAEARRLYELQRTKSYVLESQPPGHYRSTSLSGIPVHLQADLSLGRAPARPRDVASSGPSGKYLVPAQEEEEDEPCETSPERIRNPRDRPRRKDIKRSTCRNLMGAFREAGANGQVLGRSNLGLGSFDRTRHCRFFDWDAFFAPEARPASEASSSTVRSLSLRSEESSFSESSIASTSMATDIHIGAVHQPNDSCIDFHMDGSSDMGSSLAVKFPIIPLSNVIATRGCGLDASEVAVVARAVISSLHGLHSRNFVHRHVSPDMILVDDLFDIQAAQLQQCSTVMSLGDSIRLSDRSGITPAEFAAPEVARVGKGHVIYSPASDMWSLGATLLAITMPRGERPGPFGKGSITQDRHCPPENASTDDVQHWVQNRLWNYMNCIVPSVDMHDPAPIDIQALVQMLMRADPAQRASSAYLSNSSWVASIGQQQQQEAQDEPLAHMSGDPETPDSLQTTSQSGGTPPSILRARRTASATRASSIRSSEETADSPPRLSQRPRHPAGATRSIHMVGSVCSTHPRPADARRLHVHTEEASNGPGVWASVCDFFCGNRK